MNVGHVFRTISGKGLRWISKKLSRRKYFATDTSLISLKIFILNSFYTCGKKGFSRSSQPFQQWKYQLVSSSLEAECNRFQRHHWGKIFLFPSRLMNIHTSPPKPTSSVMELSRSEWDGKQRRTFIKSEECLVNVRRIKNFHFFPPPTPQGSALVSLELSGEWNICIN